MKHFVLIILFLFISIITYGQSASYDKITLISGEVYVGTIVVKNNEFVMIKTTNNARYQFPVSQIKSIEKTDTDSSLPAPNTSATTTLPTVNGNFSGMIEVAEGLISASPTLPGSLASEINLCFGNKKMLGKNYFMGLGAGYLHIGTQSQTNKANYIPVFIRLRSTISQSSTSPFIEMNAGYMFATSSANLQGGPLIRLMAGISHQLNIKSALYGGLFANLNYFNGNIKYINTSLSDSYYTGKGTIASLEFGVRAGLQF